ncbi:hypothetical protein EW026_g5567 [Hermanssonia centrifuga]|uniref:Uncharacterized protein n=1 Tax=Hermanssonia centrifuga TaxID=98765 RepID=A0A4S4KDS5_9APHY|nr:hypothetical protein EW026_g5567 [Hermanssonia centrifuga]
MLTPSFVQTIVWFGFVGTYARYLVPFIMSYDFNNVLATASDPFFVFVNDYCRDCMFAIIVACAVMLAVTIHLSADTHDTLNNNFPLPDAFAVMSMTSALASIVLSLVYTSHLRSVQQSRAHIAKWVVDARIMSSSSWHTVPILLASPAMLLVWSIIFFACYRITSTMQVILDKEGIMLPVLLPRGLMMQLTVTGFTFVTYLYVFVTARAFQNLEASDLTDLKQILFVSL